MRRKPLLTLSILGLALAVALLVAASLGTVHVPLPEIAAISLKRALGITIGVPWSETQEMIVWELRLPRVLGAATVGAALAAAGVLFQGLLRNPMADPYLLGTSGGAALAASASAATEASRSTPILTRGPEPSTDWRQARARTGSRRESRLE